MTLVFPLSPAPSYYNSFDWVTAGRKRNGVHYVGDTVTLHLIANTGTESGPHTGTFEGGVQGATISTSDVGAANHWNDVNGSPTYDNTHSYDSLSAKFTASGYVGWTYTGFGLAEEYHSFYMYATAFPTAQINALRTQQSFIGLRTDGKFVFATSTETTPTAPRIIGTAIALNQWVRVEVHIVNAAGAGGSITVRLFNNPDSTTATATITDTIAGTGPSSLNNLVRFGSQGSYGSTVWFDNCAGFGTDWFGPAAAGGGVDLSRSYSVRDYFGNIVSSGTFTGLTLTPDVPAGGWDPGWYRVYLTGPNTDTLFGTSYGATNFCVIRSDANFTAMPAATVAGNAGQGETPDYVMKGVMGLGTSRLAVSNATNLSSGDTLAIAEAEAVLTASYWSDNGIPDPERPARNPWCTFPNGGYTAGQQAGVTTAVAALYPLGVTRFEGPQNEPETGTVTLTATTASHMQAFQSAVHAGNASAKAIGPCAVDIGRLSMWRAFGDAGGFGYCDEVSFHAYNFATNGDLNLGRSTLQGFVSMLAEYGADTKPRWQTESTHTFASVYGVYHPRRARVPLLQILLMEQFDIPRERNSMWYDVSHGFWDYPSWLENGDGSLNPQCVLGRVLAEETWGKPYASALDFGSPGNNIFLGNVYTASSGESTVAIMAGSYIPGASVTLAVIGTTNPLTVVDGLGNETTADITHGETTLVVTDVPVYVQLPSGASVTVSAWNDQQTPAAVSLADVSARVLGAATHTEIADAAFQTNYGSHAGIAYSNVVNSGNSATDPDPGFPGDTAYVLWNSPVTFSRLIVWCGQSWQSAGTLIDFDIQTTDDVGTTRTTRKTVTRTTPSSFMFGTDSTNAGCQRETFWDEQWIFDESLPAPVTCTGIRLNVRATSYGGAPDWAALQTGGDQGGYQRLVVQEIAAYLSDAEIPPEPDESTPTVYGVTIVDGRPTFIRVRLN